LLQGTDVDAVYAWTAGADSIRLVTQYAEFGLNKKLPLIGYSGLSDEVILSSAGNAALELWR